MSPPTHQRVCPTCGAPLGEQARFCGQCGATLAPAPARPLGEDEETAARPMPSLEAFERDLAVATGQPPPSLSPPTPLASQLPAEVVALAREPASSLASTMIDPGTEERARVIREVMARAEAQLAANPSAAGAGFGKTMVLGGEQPFSRNEAPTALVPPIAALPHPTSSPPGMDRGEPPDARAGERLQDADAARPPQEWREPNDAHDPRKPDASPLSRSVLAPGSWLPPAPATASSPGAAAARTMLGMPAASLPAAVPAATPAEAPTAAPAAVPLASAAKTMLGVAVPGIAPSQATASSPPQEPPPPAHGHPQGAWRLPSQQGTLLGVAVPGIAPAGPPRAPAGAPGHAHVRSGLPTALGLGAAPAYSAGPPLSPPIVPAPPPLHDEPIPPGPRRPPKRGIPAVAVVAIVMVVVALGSGGIFLAMRGSTTLTAQPQLDDTGRESLRLTCATCPDGTTATLGASSTTFQSRGAVLALPAPLSIGDNELALTLARPAKGRAEEVKVHVPVAYRVRADLTTLATLPAAVTVRVEALPGSDVRVDGKPLSLDTAGKGAYALDVSPELEGPSDDVKTFERKIAFAITPKNGKPESGELMARVAVTPLHIDAPGVTLYTDKATAPFAGQTKSGGTVQVEGASAPLDAQGRFAVRTDVGSAPERTFRIVAASPPLAPRTARVRVVKVTSLDEAAGALAAKAPLPFGVFARDTTASTGKDGVIEGEVVRAVVTGSHSVLLVDEKKSCARGVQGAQEKGSAPCLVRVLHGDELKVAPGDAVRAFGRVNGTVTAGGQSVPELDAALVLPLGPSKGGVRR